MPINRDYRVQLGFSNAENLKKYFKATDIVVVNWTKIEEYNKRIKNIFSSLNSVVNDDIKYENMDNFNKKIDDAYTILKENNIIPKLNNNGRSPENVYYNWMRGYAICEFFSKALSSVFQIPQNAIKSVGKDQLINIETFSKSPTADLEISIDNQIIRLEIQSGFTGINDIKAHKVHEATRLFKSKQISSYIVHFDLFNGCAAIIDISSIESNHICWEHRAQFENQVVFAIPESSFKWHLTDKPIHYTNIIT